MLKSLVVTIATLTTAPVTAQELHRFEVTPLFGVTTGGGFEQTTTTDALDLDEASNIGIALNLQATAFSQYEIYYSRQNNQVRNTGLFASQPVFDMDIEYFQFGGTYLFDGQRLRPYIVATLGVSRFSPGPGAFDDETFFAFSGGGGINYAINDVIGMRLEGRGFASYVKDETDIFCSLSADANLCVVTATGDLVTQWSANLGLTFKF